MTDGAAFRQYLIRIAVINWLLSLFKANPELCTYEGLMDELAEWLLSDTCALEGCDNPLIGYKITAFFCCHEHAKKAWDEANKRKDYHKAYNQTPERKAWNKARTQTPEYKEYKKDYDRARYKTPEYRDYQRDYYARKKAERLVAIEAE